MQLQGIIEIFGMKLSATVEVKEPRSLGVHFVKSTGKYKAYGFENGKMKFYGYHDTKEQATEAARLRQNTAVKMSEHVTYDAKGGSWKVRLRISGKLQSLGAYGTYGHAILVRDVVARRIGRAPIVPDYEMPLALVSNPIARSYIRERIDNVTPEQATEYERRVAALNASGGRS